MNKSLLIFVGVLFTVVFSLSGLVLVPDWQFSGIGPFLAEGADPSEAYPQPLSGGAEQGHAVYVDLGCVYCHSQQVRPEGFGADINRGWGNRRTVMRDYLFETVNLMGTMRTGPDLANIGARQPSRDWHNLHLYNPAITSPGSTMPPHPFLFEEGADMQHVPHGAIMLPAEWQTSEVKYIVPNARGKALVDYLISLNRQFPLPEAQ